jgi:ATP-dependent Clp protease protease subunit
MATKKPLTAKTPIKFPDATKEGDAKDFDDVSLESLGAYMLYGSVDNDSAKSLAEFIIKANCWFPKEKELTIFINSPGGDVYDGFSIIDVMECSRLKIHTVALGQVGSMAPLIFTAGTPGHRRMARNSFIMTHQFSSWFEGKYHELMANRKHEDEIHSRFVHHFLTKTKMSEKQIKDILLGPSDNWISAKEALKLGICDIVKDPWE